MRKRILLVFKLACSMFSSTLLAQSPEPVLEYWVYHGQNTSITTVFAGTHNQMQDNYYVEIGGVDMGDSNYVRFEKLFNMGVIYGQNSPYVRGVDLVEDYDLNWSTEGLIAQPSGSRSRWTGLENNHSTGTTSFLTTANTGPHPNEYFFLNENIIAMMDDRAVFYNDNGKDDEGNDNPGTLSYYHLSGGLDRNLTWTTLSGAGTLSGQVLSKSMLKEFFIGAEEGVLAFLVAPNKIEFYHIDTGVYWREADYSLVTTGPFAGGATLADLIDGRVEGWYYFGIDGTGTPGPSFVNITVVPEPSSIALVGVAGLAALYLRRRK